MNVYIDESGFTGADYCNNEQPLFVLACTWFDNDYATKIEEDITKKFGCKEVKFSKLISSGKGQGEIFNLIDKFNDDNSQNKYAAYVVNKKSALVRKFILDCIDPTLHLQGIDIHENGLSVAYANIISSIMPVFMGKDWYDEFLILYNGLIRSKNDSDNEALFKHCEKTLDNNNVSEILQPYLQCPALVMNEIRHTSYKADMYDQITMGLIAHVRNAFGISEFDVVADHTKATTPDNLDSFLKMFELLKVDHKMSEICTLRSDIKISSVKMVDSKQAIGIRMSDLIAGLFSWSFKTIENTASLMSVKLQRKISSKNMIHMISSQEVTPEGLGMNGARNPWT